MLRLHTKEDGSREFAQLSDEDDNPDTITFSTDKFSPYAIAMSTSRQHPVFRGRTRVTGGSEMQPEL